MPPPQRRIVAGIWRELWSRGRSFRGFSNTTAVLLGALLVLGRTAPAAGQSAGEAGASSSAGAHESWSRRLALSHFERGLEHERQGDVAPALREYTEALTIDGTLGEAYLKLGALREKLGDPREAELVYSAAARLGDARARALLRLSQLHRAQGQSAQAVRDLEASVELDASPEGLELLAHHYVEAHAWAAALATYRRIAGNARANGDLAALEAARLEVRALRVLAAETDPSTQRAKKHAWVARALEHIARR